MKTSRSLREMDDTLGVGCHSLCSPGNDDETRKKYWKD